VAVALQLILLNKIGCMKCHPRDEYKWRRHSDFQILVHSLRYGQKTSQK